MTKKAKVVEGATEVTLEKPIDNTIILKANHQLSEAGYQLLVERVEALNDTWAGEFKFILIPYSVDVQE
jgi:hypothetical protein